MRHRDNIVCGDALKAHLHRLPDMRVHEVPPKIEMPSKAGLVIIPLFAGEPGYSGCEESGCISALWAGRSWLLNSDAMDYGIEVKFYMDRTYAKSIDIIVEKQ